MRIFYILLLLYGVGAMILPHHAHAQRQIAAGDACPTAGINSAHYDNFLVCTASVWVRQPVALGASAATCSGTYAGYLRWTGSQFEFCNGTAWGGLVSAAGSTTELQYNNSGSVGGAAATSYSPGSLPQFNITAQAATTVPLAIKLAAAQTGHAIAITTIADVTDLMNDAKGHIRSSNTSAASPAHSFDGDPNTGFYRNSADVLGFSTTGLARFHINGISSPGGVIMGTTATANDGAALKVFGYAQFEDNNAGAPPAADCDNNAEIGRWSIDTSNNRVYICMGATRAWDYFDLTN